LEKGSFGREKKKKKEKNRGGVGRCEPKKNESQEEAVEQIYQGENHGRGGGRNGIVHRTASSGREKLAGGVSGAGKGRIQ